MKKEFTLTLREEEVEVELDIDYSAYYQAAKLGGPPEDCYPEDSEMTIDEVSFPSEVVEAYTDAELQEAVEAIMDKVEEACWEDFFSVEYDGPEYDPEDN